MARPKSKQKERRPRDGGVQPKHAATWWHRLSPPKQHAICLGFLLLVSLGFFAPIHFTSKSLIGGDTVHWRAAAQVMIQFEEETGRQALWDPNMFGGMPGYMIHYAPTIPQLDTIATWLRGFVWPTSHFIFLLFGTYLFVFFLTKEHWAGVLAACAYGLTTYLPVLLSAGHNSKFIALCFAPWMALAFAYVMRRPRLLSGLLFSVALAVNLRAGHVQITYYFTFLLGIWWLVEGVAAYRRGTLKAFGTATAWLAVGAVLGLLMIAQPYLINAQYADYTIRGAATGGGQGGLDWSYAMRWSQGFGEMATLLIANAFGGGGGTYWGPKPFTAGPHYVGGIVIALALLALWRLRRRAVIALGIGTLLMILFALGEHFALLNRPMFAYFPLFSLFRVPETWLSAVAFTLAVLAGFGLWYASVPGETAEAVRERSKAVYVVAGGMLAVTVLLTIGKGAFFDFEKPNEPATVAAQIARSNNVSVDDPRVAQAAQQYVQQQRAEREGLFTSDAWRTFLFLLLAGGLLVAYRMGKVPAWLMQAGLVVLVVLDLGGVGRRYVNADRLVPAKSAEQQIPEYAFDRFILDRRAQAGGPGHFRVLSLAAGDPMTNARPSFFYQSVGGYHGAKLRLYQDFIDHVFWDRQTGLPNANALDLLNTRYVVARGRLPGMQVAYQDDQVSVLENADALPRALFVGQMEVVADDEALWQRLQDPSFDPHRTVLFSEPIDAAVTPLDSTSSARVTLERYSPREIAWHVNTDAPRLLLASEVYYPAGWHATVDGDDVPIYRADYLLRAVPVPAGEHEVIMRFDPPLHYVGVWVSGVSTVLVYGAVLLLLGLAWRRNRPGGDEAA